MTDAITATTPSSSAATSALAKSTTLGMGDFLKLMTTQLQTQDPFNPMDNTQMAAQLAQFSSVAGISEMNNSLKGLASELTGSRVGSAAQLIGRSALVTSATAAPMADGSYAGEVTLPAAITGGTLDLVDGSGRVVQTETLGAQGAGTIPFYWDGKAADGSAAVGPLKIVVRAADAKGAAVTATTAAWGQITGVQSPASGTTRLVTALGTIDPADALQLG